MSAPESAAPAAELTDEELARLAEAEADADAGKGEVIVVTGSAIERIEVTTPSPVSVIDKADLESAGLPSIGDILQNIPAQGNAINVQFNNGGDGSTRIDLRSLGSSRTLVLVNGRRMVAGGTGADASVDLNTIPMAMIERVEVLKDGASAVYGSDAIGGVVNIITRKDFDGAEAAVYTGTSQRGDGVVYDLSFITGTTTEKANVVFSAGYFHQGGVNSADRDFAMAPKTFDWTKRTEGVGGSPTGPGGRLQLDLNKDGKPDIDGGNEAFQRDILANCASLDCIRDPATGQWRDFDPVGDLYNFQPDNHLSTPLSRYNVWGSGGYDFHSRVRGYFEGSYLNRKSDQMLAPEPLGFAGKAGDPFISEQSIYNPYGVDIPVFSRRLIEFGNRSAHQNVDTFRLVGGLEGRLPESLPGLGDWRWDLSFNYGRTQGTQINRGNLIKSHLAHELGPSFVDEQGVARCGTRDKVIPSCVPIDVLGPVGAISPGAIKYATYAGISGGFNEQRTALATLRGQIAKTPWGGDISLAVGGDYRQEAGGSDPDPLTATGDTTGNKSEPIHGDYDVYEGFAELSIVPVVGKGLAQWVELDGAARAFRYSTFGNGVTWKAGGLFRTLGGVAVRGTYSTSFRAPSVSDLYSGNQDSFPGVEDPCSVHDGDLSPVTARNCAAAGVPAGFRDVASQHLANVGGNPDVGKETARAFTAGLVFEPPFLEGLSVTVDYFDLSIDNAISTLGAGTILEGCYTKEVQQYCDKVHRLPSGLLDYVDDRITNVGGTDTSGIDFAVAYDYKTRAGRFKHQVEGTYLLAYDFDTGEEVLRLRALYDVNKDVNPYLKTNLTTTWGLDGYGAGFNVRYIGSIKECDKNNCIGRGISGAHTVDASITADVFGSYTFDTAAGSSSLAVGMNNVLDQDPPVIYNGALASSDAATYDYMGRYFYARFSQRF